MKQQHEEISVWDLLIFCKSIFNNSKKHLKRVFVFWTVIFVIAVFGFFILGEKYKSEMYISARNMNRQELTSQILYLNSLIENGNIQELTENLHISEKDAKSLKSFEIEPFRADKLLLESASEESIKDVAESKITLIAKNNNVFSLLNNSLIDYLNNSKYSELLNTSEKYQLQTLINTYTSEIIKLDSLESKKSNKYNIKKEEGVSFLFDGPSEVAKARISLIEKIAQTAKDLKTNIGVKVIKQFYTPSKPSMKISYLLMVICCVLLTFITSVLIAVLEVINKNISEYQELNS